MNAPSRMNQVQEQLVVDTIRKNGWWSADLGIHVEVWLTIIKLAEQPEQIKTEVAKRARMRSGNNI